MTQTGLPRALPENHNTRNDLLDLHILCAIDHVARYNHRPCDGCYGSHGPYNLPLVIHSGRWSWLSLKNLLALPIRFRCLLSGALCYGDVGCPESLPRSSFSESCKAESRSRLRCP